MSKIIDPAERAGSTRRNTMVMRQVDKQIREGTATPMKEKTNINNASKMGGGKK